VTNRERKKEKKEFLFKTYLNYVARNRHAKKSFETENLWAIGNNKNGFRPV